MKYFIYHFTFIPHRLIKNHKSPAANVSVFIAQLVIASLQKREVTGSNPVEFHLFLIEARRSVLILISVIARGREAWTNFI